MVRARTVVARATGLAICLASTPAAPSRSTSHNTLAVELDGETRTIRRITGRPVVVEADRPHRARATSTELSPPQVEVIDLVTARRFSGVGAGS